MNAADKAIEEIRQVRHRISAECGNDIARYTAYLRGEEKNYQEQIKRGEEVLRQRKVAHPGKDERIDDILVLRERPKR